MAASGWIDIHGHFAPPSSDEERRKKAAAWTKANFLVSELRNWSPEETIEYLDKAGVQMQMLSYLPADLKALKESNDYGASVVKKYPTRFGLMAAIPTDDVEAALAEVERTSTELNCDGFAVTCCYNNVYLSDKILDPLWSRLNEMNATVFCHPGTFAQSPLSQALPLIEVAFETTRTFVDMLYATVFLRYPNINFIVAHSGACLPALSGRLKLLGAESWNHNPNKITKQDIESQLASLYVDTAATMPTGLHAALEMVPKNHIVYGADCGVPCSTEYTMEENKSLLLNYEHLSTEERQAVGTNVLKLLPNVAKRLKAATGSH